MLDWIVRWGIPLLLLTLAIIFAGSRLDDPSHYAQDALEAFRRAAAGLIPRFF